MLLENCHQGGLTPGSRQWQTYEKVAAVGPGAAAAAAAAGNYTHRLGYLSGGDDEQPPLKGATFGACLGACSADAACGGVSFESEEAAPTAPLALCYLKRRGCSFIPYDQTDARCAFDGAPNDCPYNFYRTSGDINARFSSMLGNLASTLRYRGNLSNPAPLSRPGAWAYPDMLEVGKLANATEDRTHFGAWAVSSSPLVLGFDLGSAATLDRVWPIITNKEVINVSQSWAGHPGALLGAPFSGADFQSWAKPLGGGRHALFVLSNASAPVQVRVELGAISAQLVAPGVEVSARDIHAAKELGVVSGGSFDAGPIGPHDSVFITLTAK